MRIGALETLGIFALVIGVWALREWHQGSPDQEALTAHEGALTGRKIHIGGSNSNNRSLRLEVEGLDFTLNHDHTMPRHKKLVRLLRVGDRIVVHYDPRDSFGKRQLYGLSRADKTLLPIDEMLDWDSGNRTLGLVIGVFMLLAGIFLGTLPHWRTIQKRWAWLLGMKPTSRS